MFKNVFSPQGRIRRFEYGLTLLICYFCFISMHFFSEFFYFFSFLTNSALNIFILIIIILQGAKRCHDMDQPGWMALIPIYNPIVLIFVEGTVGDNKYGENPKKVTPFGSSVFNKDPFAAPTAEKTKTEQETTENKESYTSESARDKATNTSFSNQSATGSQYYVVSPDGKTLMKWFNTEATIIDMPADPVLSKITSIGKDVFYDCNKLSRIEFAENLDTIGKYAFDGCDSLKDFAFPEKLQFIGEYIFGKNCPMKLVFKGSTPPVLEGDFGYNDDRIQVIYVPFGCAENYRRAESWKKYAHLIF